jgi:hypothetical protein
MHASGDDVDVDAILVSCPCAPAPPEAELGRELIALLHLLHAGRAVALTLIRLLVSACGRPVSGHRPPAPKNPRPARLHGSSAHFACLFEHSLNI